MDKSDQTAICFACAFKGARRCDHHKKGEANFSRREIAKYTTRVSKLSKEGLESFKEILPKVTEELSFASKKKTKLQFQTYVDTIYYNRILNVLEQIEDGCTRENNTVNDEKTHNELEKENLTQKKDEIEIAAKIILELKRKITSYESDEDVLVRVKKTKYTYTSGLNEKLKHTPLETHKNTSIDGLIFSDSDFLDLNSFVKRFGIGSISYVHDNLAYHVYDEYSFDRIQSIYRTNQIDKVEFV